MTRDETVVLGSSYALENQSCERFGFLLEKIRLC